MATTSAIASERSEIARVVIASRSGPKTAARGAVATIVTGMPDTFVRSVRKWSHCWSGPMSSAGAGRDPGGGGLSSPAGGGGGGGGGRIVILDIFKSLSPSDRERRVLFGPIAS